MRHPVPAVDETRMTRWILELNSPRFATREHATHELEKCGDLAETHLLLALKGNPSLETGQRVRQILTNLEQSPERLRSLRAVEVLEHIGNPEACRLLSLLAQGEANALLTQDAKASLERLRR
jgi:hypothetical protein